MTSSRYASRRGLTLVEMMISLVLFGAVMMVGLQVLVRQQRFHRGATAVMDVRHQLRHAAHVLPSDLRAIYPAGGDIYAWTRSAIEFRANTGSGVLCLRPTATTIVLPPITLTQNNVLTTWMTAPQVGDSILVYDDNVGIGNDDDVWRAHQITGVAQVTGVSACPTSSGFTLVADATTPSWQLTISPGLTTTTVPGAPTRLFRRTRYELYQATDGEWYLGTSDCVAGRTPVCSANSPVSGPYRALNVNPLLSGIQFSYLDATGVELDPASAAPASIARIRLVVRGETQTPFNTMAATGTYRDSLTFVVGLRNRQ